MSKHGSSEHESKGAASPEFAADVTEEFLETLAFSKDDLGTPV